jgi:tetratricopeptide (TPR) repeat protein
MRWAVVTWPLLGLTAAAVTSLAVNPPVQGHSPTPAEQRIAAAERAIAVKPSADAYNDLALALARRARETSDPVYYAKAAGAIDSSLKLAPDNFEALKMRTWVWLGQHEYAKALELATVLNKRMPDDVLVYGLLTDAYVELGRYPEAEAACQWMLDLRPGNVPALTRAAYLRELFGDIEGAMQLMTQAYDRTPPSEAEDRAWLLTQLGHLALAANRVDDAERVLEAALVQFPRYHYALAQMAKVRTRQGKHEEAAALLKERHGAAPHPENMYDLARALERAGKPDDARVAFAAFERQANAEAGNWDNANRELTFYYADVVRRPADALRVAALDFRRRQDVFTLDAYAWALFANKRTEEAREVMRRALAVGIKDPEVLGRAAAIGITP